MEEAVRSRELTHQELLLLYLRYGREDRGTTQRQVAHQLGLSLTAVRQMERSIVRQLRLSAYDPLSTGWNGWEEV